MLSRLATELLITFSPTATFLVSLVLIAPAKGQTAPHFSPAALTLPAPIPAALSDPGRYLIVYRNGQIPANLDQVLAESGARLIATHDRFGIAVAGSLTERARVELAQEAGVEAIVPDLLLKAHAVIVQRLPNPLLQTSPDGLYNSPQGWAVRQVGGFGRVGRTKTPVGPWTTTTGQGVRIAVLDSGVDAEHADLAPNLVLNLSEVDQTALPSACDDGSAADQQGHGTWTASLAAGALGPDTGLVAGVAPSASILNIKVLERLPAVATTADPTGCVNGEASGLLSWFLQGIADAIANRADIVSMSFGSLVDVTTGAGAGEQVVFDRATSAAFNAGIVLIAAAGNDATNLSGGHTIELPAQSSDVLAVVASTNPACAENLKAGATCVPGPVSLAYYTNGGSTLNALAAPGGSYPTAGALNPSTSPEIETGWVTGACSNGKLSTVSGVPSDAAHSLGCFNLGHVSYVQAIGTSASAPLVAGAAALLIAANPTWSPAAVVQALRGSAALTATLPTPQATVASLLTPRT